MKKILFLISFYFMFSFTFGIYYNFSHFPIDNQITKYSTYRDIQYIKYDGDVYVSTKNIYFDDIKDFVSKIGYFKFFRFSYFWKNTLNKVYDDKINLSYLDYTRLQYPIVGLIAYDKFIFIVHKSILNDTDKNTIGNLYFSKRLYAFKYKDFYVFKINLESQEMLSYDYKKYIDIFEKINTKFNIVTYQVGQNPFDKYDIQGFSNILQLEVFKGNKLKGIIINQTKNYTITSYSYDQEYVQDSITMENLIYIYDSIKKYYEDMSNLPENITSLDPIYADISYVNKYNRNLKYEVLSKYCYKIGFKPVSQDFKNLYKDFIKDGYFYLQSTCIR